MNQQELDILKTYLTEDEIKEIVFTQYSNLIRENIKSIRPEKRMDDYERVIGNAIHYYLQDNVNEIVESDYKQLIKDKVLKTLTASKDLSYNIFSRKGVYDKEDAIGYSTLKEAVLENSQLIKDRVANVINAIDFKLLKEDVKEYILEVIDEKLKA